MWNPSRKIFHAGEVRKIIPEIGRKFSVLEDYSGKGKIMRKSVIAILLVVVTLFTMHYAAAEQSFEELNSEFDALMDKMKRLDAIDAVMHNGCLIYPDNGWEAEYAFEAFTIFPQIPAGERGGDYCGMPFLLTGTVLDKKGYGIDFRLDDGRLAIISFSEYDFENSKMVYFGKEPKVGARINVYCTFSSQGFEMLDDNCLHFTASVTEEAKNLCLQRKR